MAPKLSTSIQSAIFCSFLYGNSNIKPIRACPPQLVYFKSSCLISILTSNLCHADYKLHHLNSLYLIALTTQLPRFLLELRFRIPPEPWSLSYVCCVLSGRGLCDGPISRPEKSYRLCCVTVCDLETSRKRKPWPAIGCCARGINMYSWGITP